MTPKNTVKHTISVSVSYLKTTKKYFYNDQNKIISNQEIYKSIFKIIKVDKHLIDTTFNDCEFKIINSRFYGIILDNDEIILFTQMLSLDNKARSRNTYILQNFKPVMKQAKILNLIKSISLNPFDIGKPCPNADSILNSFRQLKTIGFQINESLNYYNEIDNYKDIDEIINLRSSLKSRNKGNNSTYIWKDNDNQAIYLYGKTDGANYADTLSLGLSLKNVNSNYKYFYFFNLTDSDMNETKIKELSEIGYIVVSQKANAYHEFEPIINDNNISIFLKRNQAVFKANIIKKYFNIFDNESKLHCFACSYPIEENLIAAHIHRFSDIKYELQQNIISLDEAKENALSGENGLLLCPNHDKEFEKGLLIFDYNMNTFIPNNKINELEETTIFIETSLLPIDFNKIDKTDLFLGNVKKHQKRVHYI
ncbi:HNH endonuclease signature motif containing protein [Mycoplasmopsis verecunda]|uniref:HNH endonuclease n=1 Tax=Mycoplasmopsis verecunda TaxID=171291 RepID=A0A1T4KYI3_9BACT|nr:HNH endonuclease signature motif containing protein [Mycoplasmopsis verecunda]WPB54346.1 HNH endonuclease signature motif containing protein [Mycoplasmopsis verecunda]SJZ47408.1 HNH endonuclease [Mycoplasmopsis verecunda]